MKYVLGLDVGIGSVGWAVIRNEEVKRIEDFGVRIFKSGEIPGKQRNPQKARLSQERRGYRSVRRLVRRRSHRKWRIKAHLQNIGLTTVEEINKHFEEADPNIIALRVKALDEKISPPELAACLINICNRRGYNDFYEADSDSMTKEEFEEYEREHQAIGTALRIMKDGGYRTVAEMILKDEYFNIEGSDFKCYRNNSLTDRKNLFTRDMLESEVRQILDEQKKYYRQLNENNISIIMDIIFSQRNFEDGPGDPNDEYRVYKGFLDSIGNCSFYKDEKRGSRFTLLADVYSTVNVLSQFIYVDEATGEIGLTASLANELLSYVLKEGKLTLTDIKKICKSHGKRINTESKADLSKCLKFTKAIKPVFEDAGYIWSELSADYASIDGILNKTGIFLSENITPKRRKEKAEKELAFLDKSLADKLMSKQASGTANACYKFMTDSINAFLRGESYGSFQAVINGQNDSELQKSEKHYILPSFERDYEFYSNPVVFRSINETRKIINAVVRKYGSPFAINIEVASELNKSLEDRIKDELNQRKNEKNNAAARAAVAEILKISPGDVTPAQVERYKLGEEQGWKCLYSGETINDKKEAIENKHHTYEVDHIVPFSLILDDTLNNKALVRFSENQFKGQKTPLMYMSAEKAKNFRGLVNVLYKNKKISTRKYKYLMLETFDNELLSEWKSRNLNDTRYISIFLVNYLKNNLQFSSEDKGKYERGGVYPVKGAITSRMRRQWLNNTTWGTKNKAELKAITYLDHAADAIVIANCLPAYVEMAALNQKLKDIFYSAGKKETDEYKSVLTDAMENMMKFYGVPKSVSEHYLRYKKNTPSLVPDLRHEADLRLFDFETDRYFAKKAAEEKGYEYKEESDEAIEERFRKAVTSYYSYDPQFANSVNMPITSHKQDKKVNKKLFADNPISVRNIDGIDYQIVSKSIMTLKKKDIPDIYTNDSRLIAEITELLASYKDEATVGEALNANGKTEFIYNSRPVRKLKLKKKAPNRYFVKEIDDGNHTVLDNTFYYCVEVYKDLKGNTSICAIAYSDIVISDGKLYLREEYRRPDNYKEHIMYLFPNDYVTISDGKKKFEGYYRSIKNANRNLLYMLNPNTNNSVIIGITHNADLHKYDIDILGKKGGEIRCGEPLLSIREKS